MEENKKDELDVEVIDDELEEDEDIEEFDFNDDDIDDEDIDGEDEDTDLEVDGDVDEEVDEDEEDTSNTEEGGDVDGGTTEEGRSEEPKAEPSDDKAFEMELLKELGYTGNYEEAKAKYMADKNGSTPTGAVDYDAMASDALKQINEEFGLELKDFSGFENIELFAELCLNDKYGAVKAFAATNHKLVMEGAANKAKKDFVSKLKPPSKDHLSKLPTSGGGEAKAQGDRISRAEYMELKALYPNLSKEEIIKTIRRVRKNTKK